MTRFDTPEWGYDFACGNAPMTNTAEFFLLSSQDHAWQFPLVLTLIGSFSGLFLNYVTTVPTWSKLARVQYSFRTEDSPRHEKLDLHKFTRCKYGAKQCKPGVKMVRPQFTWGCKFEGKCGIYHLCLLFNLSLHFFAPNLH